MIDPLEERLNKIPQRLTDRGFLKGGGIGNELAFYIFDYPAEEELRIREHIPFLLTHLGKTHPALRIIHLNLFEFVVDLLKERDFLTKSFAKQKAQGDAALIKSLTSSLDPDKLAPAVAKAVSPGSHDVVIISGAGSVWPMVRTHGVLSSLQRHMGYTPTVFFYPGIYDGQSLRLFGKLKSNYYRAFKLVP